MKNTIICFIAFLCISNPIKSQTYSQTFENVSIAQLQDSGWLAAGVSIGNSSKLTGTKELVTQLLNTSTSTSTYIVTSYFKGSGINILQFQHVINNSSGKDIDLTIYAIDSTGAVIGSFVYTYGNSNTVNSVWSFTKNGSFKLKFEWSGAKTRSGSTAALDMILVNKPLAPLNLFPLPVNLISFMAVPMFGNGELEWSATSDGILSSFEVLRSSDGIHFSAIGTVNASANKNELTTYNFNDANITSLNQPVFYYQLRLINNNGSTKLSQVIQMKIKDSGIPVKMNIVPNPSSDFINITLTEIPQSDISIQITDLNGKNVQQTANVEIKGCTAVCDIRFFEKGIYFINISNNDGSITTGKFIKR